MKMIPTLIFSWLIENKQTPNQPDENKQCNASKYLYIANVSNIYIYENMLINCLTL